MTIALLLLNSYAKMGSYEHDEFCMKLMMDDVVVVRLMMNSCSNVVVVVVVVECVVDE
jgi:hypothetical protein